MELEVRELDAASRNKYFTRIKSYRVELSRLEKEFNNKRLHKSGDREELLGDAEAEETNDQNQFLINSEKLERGKNRLEAGYQVIIETEQIGNNILADLNQQRETVHRTRNRVSSCKFHQCFALKSLSKLVERDRSRTWSKRTFA